MPACVGGSEPPGLSTATAINGLRASRAGVTRSLWSFLPSVVQRRIRDDHVPPIHCWKFVPNRLWKRLTSTSGLRGSKVRVQR